MKFTPEQTEQRGILAAKMKRDGKTLKEIGAAIGGVSVERARQVAVVGERILIRLDMQKSLPNTVKPTN